MRIFFRLLVVLGILNLSVEVIDFFVGNPLSGQGILAVILLFLGSAGLYLIKSLQPGQK